MLETGNLWDLIVARSAATPDVVMAVDERGRRLTFAGLQDDAERVAAGFAARGISEGDVVSWQLPSWTESIVLVAALARLGVTQNPILPIYREREVGFITRQAGSKLLIVPSAFRGFDHAAMARGIAAEVPGLEVLVSDRALPEGDPSALGASPRGDAVRWLFYTSGTTADPKGAQHTDATVAAAAAGMAERLALVAEDRNALVFPFTHIGGIIWMFAGLMVGLTNIVDEAFGPGTVELLKRENVTLAGSGTFFHQLYLKTQRENPAERLFPYARAYPGGGAPKPPQLHYDVRKELGGAGIVSGYGLTEAPILTMASPDDPDDALANTEGSATRGVQLRVVTLEGKVAGVDEEGEIRAKGPQIMKGYLDASLDAEAFDDDGWFRTGDLGRIDPDGFVTITGRLKDIIIRKGENISAKEIEDLLFTHPAVADVAVIGLPDAASGERVCAVIAAKEGAPVPSVQAIASFLESKGVSKYKLPEQVEPVDALPRNPAGKVLKQDLKKRFG